MEDSEDSDWIEECEEDLATLCLFCEETLSGAISALQHCRKRHDFDICDVQRFHDLDCFGYIKMINYIRKTVCFASFGKTPSDRIEPEGNKMYN